MVFGGKKRRILQNFSVKMLKKISHFFALIGNTAYNIIQLFWAMANRKFVLFHIVYRSCIQLPSANEFSDFLLRLFTVLKV